ncbi:g-type lectin s-receptor-like serine/threonine-protein kinase at1g67520 [Phtheirospermum japonicum]|uniref:non-specific serine/threonine protein kinase n=1 Tax=Phtheirospermum japonicum TaxID=374723 RepID=A0A830CQN2_9LAMI|nr:g-type lectin s-receptor-like serine/threonine-protein kinase at1g67520 [Phtheirospermum japonicum]
MQPHKASTATLILIATLCLATQASSTDTLQQGDTLNSSSQLVSANRLFTLGFHTPQNTNNSYLAIWYTNGSYPPVWIGNRENPIPPNSNPILTIGAAGNLTITHGGGESFEVYSGGSRNNLSATLLDSGNFVVSEMSSFLWQSFDYPTDTLLPGMKLGFNRRTGRNWTISSWFDENNPATGAFTMEWDPIVGRLLIRRRGVTYWSSGQMKDYHVDLGDLRVKEFENIFSPDVFNLNYNFTNVTNGEEEYFSYTLLNVPNWTPDERKVISGWRLNYNGDIRDTDRVIKIADSSQCYGYKPKRSVISAGCELWEQPTCRNDRQTFDFRAGVFSAVNGPEAVYDRNSSLGPSDCREICWDDCLCVGYSHDFVTEGCVHWRGRNVEFVQSLDGVTNANRMYVLETAPSGKGMKKHVKIILGVVSAIVVLVSGLALFIVRKLQKGKREEELHKLLTLDGYTGDNGGGKSNDLRLFTYSSIQSATRNFSSDYKLGQGGFGPVYKGKTSEGQDIAVKLLSRQSGQGLLEFKTELILISKLQHVNLLSL